MTDDDLLASLRALDGRSPDTASQRMLETLRRRLAGELVGDPEWVASTLAPTFELVMHGGGASTTISREQLVASIRRQAGADTIMWTDLADLAVDGKVVAGQGTMSTLTSGAGGSSFSTLPLAFFIRFDSTGLMVSEIAYTEPGAAVMTAWTGSLPSKEYLRAALG